MALPRRGSLGYVAYVLALIGGMMIVLSLLALLSFAIFLPFGSPLGGYFGSGVISLILGIVALVGEFFLTATVPNAVSFTAMVNEGREWLKPYLSRA